MRFLFLLLCCSTLSAKPSLVVIVGGGPAGLASSIVAKKSGANVTVLEKRETYSRNQTLFLFDASIKLLESWDVQSSQLKKIDIGNGERIGITRIRELEEALHHRAKEMGVQFKFAEFKGIVENKIKIESDKSETLLDYDLLIGADGAHSQVREALGIKTTLFGQAIGAVFGIPGNLNKDFIATEKVDGIFIRKIETSSSHLIFLQSEERLSKDAFLALLKKVGWMSEDANQTTQYNLGIPVLLQQAAIFSDEKRKALIVGDAAAVASFFDGMGANTAIISSLHVGEFLSTSEGNIAFQNYEKSMKETTDKLIDGSLYLFQKVEN